MKSSIVFFIAFCCSCFSISAQLSRDSLYTRQLLLDDLDSLKHTILISHPAPFAFCGEAAFHEAFEAGRSEVDSMMTGRDFSRVVAKCIKVMDDSHATPDYGQMLEMALAKPEDYLVPFSVYRSEHDKGGDYDLLILRDWEEALPKGGKLISINGMDTHQLYDIAFDYACTEGSALNSEHAVATALLSYVNGLYNVADSVNSFEVIPYGIDKPQTFYLKGYHKKEFKELRKERNKLPINKWIDTQYDEANSLAILKIATFAPPSSRKFKKQVKGTFKKIAEEGYENLVIDIRGNGGGSSSWVEYLYSFLDTAGYSTPSNVIARNSQLALSRNPLADTRLAKAFMWLFYRHDEDVQSFKHFRALPLGEVDTVYFKDKTIQKKELVFNRNAYLLINGMSASASVDFTYAFMKNKRGSIVGESCMGPQTGTWGNPAKYTLPNSDINVTISTIRYSYDNTFVYMRNPIEPDYWIGNNAEDLSKETDTQLEFVKTLIKKK